MSAPVILIVLLLAFLVFFLWDRRRMNSRTVRPLSRERMDKGVTPSAALGWPVAVAGGMLALGLAFAQWQAPTPRPYAGRWTWFSEALFLAFGPSGMAGFLWAMGLVAVGCGLIRGWQSRQDARMR